MVYDSVFQLEVMTFVLDDGEFPVDWGSGLSFKAKYRPLAWQLLSQSHQNHVPLMNVEHSWLGDKVKENQKNANTEVFLGCDLRLSATKFYFYLLLKIICKLWIAIFFEKRVKNTHTYMIH